MSERKVLRRCPANLTTSQPKYYPPEFDPNAIKRARGPKQSGPRVQTVRLMAPFSMKCTTCGEFIYRGRKFNARKESHQGERYLGIQIHRFSIRCTRCSSEIVFKTDPKNQDYALTQGAKRNMEPWRPRDVDETDEQRLDRLEAEEAEADELDRMQELEAKTIDAKREMDVADALDEIRMRNARHERADRDGVEPNATAELDDEEQMRLQQQDEAAAKAAFAFAREQERWEEPIDEVDEPSGEASSSGASTGTPPLPSPAPVVAAAAPAAPREDAVPSFKRQVKKKKDFAAALGIKKKPALA